MKLKLLLPIVLIMVSSLVSCASFSKVTFRKDYNKLSKENVSRISGKYKIFPKKEYGKQYEKQDKAVLEHHDIYKSIVNEFWREKDVLSVIDFNESDYHVELKLIKNKLSLRMYKNNVLIKKTQLTGKLKKGMFYLDNKVVKCHGVPYLFGGCTANKRRIGISKNNTLIVNEAVSSEGAFLLVIGSGYNYNTSFEFERLQ